MHQSFYLLLGGRVKLKRLIGTGSVAQGICWRMRDEGGIYFADGAGLGVVKTGKKLGIVLTTTVGH